MIVGYARVSTDGQTLDAQHTTTDAFGTNWRNNSSRLGNNVVLRMVIPVAFRF
jgi:DNA invertase Pin-like site-specific DNA recombinase